MTKDSVSNYRTNVEGYKNASSPVQSIGYAAIGYAAAYPAYPLNPPLLPVVE